MCAHADRLDALANVVDFGVGDVGPGDDDHDRNGEWVKQKRPVEVHGSLGSLSAVGLRLPRTTPTTARGAGRIRVEKAVLGRAEHDGDAKGGARGCQASSVPERLRTNRRSPRWEAARFAPLRAPSASRASS